MRLELSNYLHCCVILFLRHILPNHLNFEQRLGRSPRSPTNICQIDLAVAVEMIQDLCYCQPELSLGALGTWPDL